MKKYNKVQTGYIGETFVLYQLARYKTPAILCPTSFDYDILTDKGLRIEVKTSIITSGNKKVKGKEYENRKWAFTNQQQIYQKGEQKDNMRFSRNKLSRRDRQCDFFIFVCLDKKCNPLKSYVVPKSIVKDRSGITIPEMNDCEFTEYYEKWELIVGDRTDGL